MRLEHVINPRKICLLLGLIALYLAAQSLINEYMVENVLDDNAPTSVIQVFDLFSVNAEESIPTWYSTLLLFVAAALLALIAAGKRAGQDRYSSYWIGLAIIFVYLSMDEGAVIHEILTEPLQTAFNTTGYLTFAWQIVAVPLVILFALLYLRFLFHLPARIRNLFILAAALYVGGALVVEAVSGNQLYVAGGVTFGYLAIGTVEELAEMLGVVVFIYTLLSYAVEMQYTFVIGARHSAQGAADPATAVQPDAAASTDAKGRIRRSFSPPRALILAVVLIVGMNVALVFWALTEKPAPQEVVQDSAVSTRSLIDQLATGDVVVTRMAGKFVSDNLSARQVAAALLAIYDEVTIITLASTESSIALAADELPFDRSTLTDVLQASGETQFIIFDTPAVRTIVGDITAAQD